MHDRVAAGLWFGRSGELSEAIQCPGDSGERSPAAVPDQAARGSVDLEQARRAHAAADAHGHHAVFGTAPLALDEDMAGHPGT